MSPYTVLGRSLCDSESSVKLINLNAANGPLTCAHATILNPLQAVLLQAAPLQAAPLQAVPLQAAPLQAAPLQAAPLQALSNSHCACSKTPVSTACAIQHGRHLRSWAKKLIQVAPHSELVVV